MLIKLKSKISTSRTKSQQFRLIGITGIIIVLLCNIIEPLLFNIQESAIFLTDWWSVWFPNYIVWLVLMAVGFYIRYKENNHEIKM